MHSRRQRSFDKCGDGDCPAPPRVSTSSQRVLLTTDEVEPSALVHFHHSVIHEDVFTARSRDLIVREWTCSDGGHTVCYTGQSIHRCMIDGDVDSWAREHAIGNASIKHPPESLLTLWGYNVANVYPNPLSWAPLITVHEFYPPPNHRYRPSSFYTSESSILPFIGYTSGSAVKGIGNIIIGGLQYLDTKTRVQRLRLISKHAKSIYRYERSRRRQAFHRAVLFLIAPGRQLNSLMNDLLEFRFSVDSSVFDALCSIIDYDLLFRSAYQRMKIAWLTLLAACSEEGWIEISSSSLARITSELFMCDFNSEDEACHHVTASLSHVLLHVPDAFESDHWITTHGITLTVFQSLARMDLNERPQKWKQILGAKAVAVTNSASKTALFQNIGALLNGLVAFYCELDDDHPIDSALSIWTNICEELSTSVKLSGILDEWTSQVCQPHGLVWLMMTVVLDGPDDLGVERRTALRTADILVPLLEAVPNDVWDEVANIRFAVKSFPEIEAAADRGQCCKEIALRLAREV